MIQQPGSATTRNPGITPSARNAPDKSGEREYYYERNKRDDGSTWAVATRSEWLQLIRYDLWQVYCHLWGLSSSTNGRHWLVQSAFERGLESATGDIAVNPYEGAEAVAWLRGFYRATTESGRSLLVRNQTFPHPKKTINDKLRPRHSNITNLNQAETWGAMMRYRPNGWYTQSSWGRYLEESIAGENSITRIAFTSECSGDTPSSRIGGKADGGQKRPRKYSCSTPLIKHFMPADVIPYHIAWKGLTFSHQAILWVHYASDVDYIRKLHLLSIDSDSYQNLLTLAEHKIEQTICELPEPAPEPAEQKPGTGPLWPCRIFASIHKFQVGHSGADTPSRGPTLQFPEFLSWSGFRLPIAEDENDNYVFRLANGEIYAVLPKKKYNLIRSDAALEFLELARAIMISTAAPSSKLDLSKIENENDLPNVDRPVARYNRPDWIKAHGLDVFERDCNHYAVRNRPRRKSDQRIRSY